MEAVKVLLVVNRCNGEWGVGSDGGLDVELGLKGHLKGFAAFDSSEEVGMEPGDEPWFKNPIPRT